MPRPGATDVAINTAPIVQGAFVPGSVRVEDQHGELVNVTIHEGTLNGCGALWAEIIPKSPWAPQTKFTIRVDRMFTDRWVSNEDESLSFVTGVDSLPDPPLDPPSAKASILTGRPKIAVTCGSFAALSCVHVDGEPELRREVELTARRGDEVVLRMLLPYPDLSYALDAVPECFELRRRSPTGKRSAPRVLCGGDLPRWTLKQDVPLGEPECRNGKFEFESSEMSAMSEPAGSASQPSAAETEQASHREYGCAAIPREPTRGSGVTLLGLVASALLLRRKFRTRTRVASTSREDPTIKITSERQRQRC